MRIGLKQKYMVHSQRYARTIATLKKIEWSIELRLFFHHCSEIGIAGYTHLVLHARWLRDNRTISDPLKLPKRAWGVILTRPSSSSS